MIVHASAPARSCRGETTGLRGALTVFCAVALWAGAAAAEDRHLARHDRVPVVAHAVICKPDLLRCMDLGTDDRSFESIRACRRTLPQLKKELRPIGTARTDVVLAKCRYSLLESSERDGWRVRRLVHSAPAAPQGRRSRP